MTILFIVVVTGSVHVDREIRIQERRGLPIYRLGLLDQYFIYLGTDFIPIECFHQVNLPSGQKRLGGLH